VIVSTIHAAHWRLWPNGHPVVRLASGRDLDVIALANDRLRSDSPASPPFTLMPRQPTPITRRSRFAA
jgi:hypothetical protein